MHTHYIKVYHEINVTPVQKRKLKIDMQVTTLRIKTSNLFNGLKFFLGFLWYINVMKKVFTLTF